MVLCLLPGGNLMEEAFHIKEPNQTKTPNQNPKAQHYIYSVENWRGELW